MFILEAAPVRVEKDGVVLEGCELRLLCDEGQFAIVVVSTDKIIINMVMVAADALFAYRQFTLVAALPLMTEKLASDAMVMACPLPTGATLADPYLDTQAVRSAIGNAEVDRILVLPLPELTAAFCST